MSLPPHFSEAEFLKVIEHISKILQTKFGYLFGADDFSQEVAVWSLEALPKFNPVIGSLGAYLFRNARNRALNAHRDKVCRRDNPCEACHSGTPCGGDGAHCNKYARWLKRNKSKASLSRPLGLAGMSEEAESPAHAPSTAEELAVGAELSELIDRHLPVSLRSDYLRMLAGEGTTISLERRNRVKLAVAEILGEPGLLDTEGAVTTEEAETESQCNKGTYG